MRESVYEGISDHKLESNGEHAREHIREHKQRLSKFWSRGYDREDNQTGAEIEGILVYYKYIDTQDNGCR